MTFNPFETKDSAWQAPEIDHKKTIIITEKTDKELKQKMDNFKNNGYTPGIMSRSIYTYFKDTRGN